MKPLDTAAAMAEHLELLTSWVTHPRSEFWGMLGLSREEVLSEQVRIAEHPHHHAWLGHVDGEPAFLCETYDPARSDLARLTDLPDLADGDLGMHVLVAPPVRRVPGFTRRVFSAVMDHCFADPAVRRVVVEPDVRNSAIQRLNAEAGFVVERLVPLGGKTAALSFCTRAAYAVSDLGGRR